MADACYVHVPFCRSICYYCAFCRWIYDENRIDPWLDQIQKEVHAKSISHLKTLYFGGGTPNSLSESAFIKLASFFKPYLDNNYEWTVECNPEYVTQEQAALYQKLGVNRISLGVQTFSNTKLQAIGRTHSIKQVTDAISYFKKAGIHNISIDLIYALPNQTLEEVKEDLAHTFALDVKHLSIYSLQIEENSVFGKWHILLCDEDLEADMYETIVSACVEHGFEHYEISSFAKEKAYSLHNLHYWSDQDFYGIGCGASGKENGLLYENTKDMQIYLKEGPNPVYLEEDNAFDAIMMALRTSFGLNVDQWQKKYQKDFHTSYQNVLRKYIPEYLVYEKPYLKPTPKGMEILNTILVDFLDVN